MKLEIYGLTLDQIETLSDWVIFRWRDATVEVGGLKLYELRAMLKVNASIEPIHGKKKKEVDSEVKR